MIVLLDFRKRRNRNQAERAPPCSSRIHQARLVAVVIPCQALWKEGLQTPAAAGLWPLQPPTSLPAWSSQPQESQSFCGNLSCVRLLDQTGVGAGAALCQMVGMEGKRQLEGIELEGVRALFLPAWAQPGDCRLRPQGPSVGGSGRLRPGEPVCGMLER